MKWCVMGRTASGKDMLAGFCEAYGMRRLRSYTTRPRRDDMDVGHTFVTADEAAAIPGHVAETRIGDDLYFMTRGQVEDADLVVIDPDGLFELTRAMPDEDFAVIVVSASRDARRARYGLRGSDGKGFDERDAQETERFDGFRDRFQDAPPDNVCALYEFDNGPDGTDRAERMARIMAGWEDGMRALEALDDERHFVDWDHVDDGMPRHRVFARLYGDDASMAAIARKDVPDAWLAHAAREHCPDWALADMMRSMLPTDDPTGDGA